MEKRVVDGGNGEAKEVEREIITLFVDNLPMEIHWKGLWKVFGRQGSVNVFIASKISRRGSRFAFVRTDNRVDALRMIGRLNGLRIKNNIISVSFASSGSKGSDRKDVLADSRDSRNFKGESGRVSEGLELKKKSIIGMLNRRKRGS
ncbi:hypothetical protein F3Y22_tig00111833pilonHSYRG00038 [Hibiscus syriacus]|uniref:RRM domain-containing protein n=1 Tax=Hibiscus syriacus TaxID=106335 RepID=A0A6A2YG67_HIBSY|nr:hypothetical protein F3Y22_tig00111833pilonHSYRG00038 [Hibiscus syriacus]